MKTTKIFTFDKCFTETNDLKIDIFTYNEDITIINARRYLVKQIKKKEIKRLFLLSVQGGFPLDAYKALAELQKRFDNE